MTRLAFLATIFSFALAGPAFAAKPPVYTVPGSDLAAGGYDVVSFFEGEAMRGSAEYTTRYNGAVWQFNSAENLKRFEKDPAAYAPQYGGYCAWAVAQGYLAKGDPRFATVVAGKLYLNFNGNIQAKWSRDIPGQIANANANWPGILDR
ncbi:YHS domain-containing (seleno)protein [Parvularcula marina]|uniref:YHS domain-containing (seleno)protein n=1 Tax=Parvularcula marina TaxID=2292771 RepID=UPI0035143B7E